MLWSGSLGNRMDFNKSPVPSRENVEGFVAAVFKSHHIGGFCDIGLDKAPYRQVPTGESTRRFISAIQISFEKGGTESSSLLEEEMMCHFREARPGHGSVFKQLCDLKIICPRFFKDENGVDKSWEDASHIRNEISKWCLFDSRVPGQKRVLDDEEVSDLEGHKECCEKWVGEMLGQGYQRK